MALPNLPQKGEVPGEHRLIPDLNFDPVWQGSSAQTKKFTSAPL